MCFNFENVSGPHRRGPYAERTKARRRAARTLLHSYAVVLLGSLGADNWFEFVLWGDSALHRTSASSAAGPSRRFDREAVVDQLISHDDRHPIDRDRSFFRTSREAAR